MVVEFCKSVRLLGCFGSSVFLNELSGFYKVVLERIGITPISHGQLLWNVLKSIWLSLPSPIHSHSTLFPN